MCHVRIRVSRQYRACGVDGLARVVFLEGVSRHAWYAMARCGGPEYLRGVRDRCWGPDACGVWSASGRLNLDTHATSSWWRGRVYQAESPHDREYGG
eukprot:5371634-Prymnesium_polylepis.1